MSRQRLGVALLIPPPVGVEIDALRKAVGDDDVSRIAPHITLVPPVNVREEMIEDAVELLATAAAAISPLHLVLGPVATFAPVSPTLHLEVGGDLDDLRALRDEVFAGPLLRNLTHPFVPHVTLIEDTTRIEAGLEALRGYRAEVTIQRVHLMRESRDDDGVRIWRPLADWLLGATTSVVGRGGVELELSPSGVLPPEAEQWANDRWADFDVERFGEVRPLPEPVSIVARLDGHIVGIASGEVRHDAEAYLANLMVDAAHRNLGIGAKLVAAFSSAVADRDATFVTLRTEADGNARRFYERLGFTQQYRLPAWRSGRDFVTLRRDL